MLRLTCPICGTDHADEYECIESNEVGAIRCEGLTSGHVFWFIACECLRCGEESTYKWPEVPPPVELAKLRCTHCGVPIDEAYSKEQTESAPQRFQ